MITRLRFLGTLGAGVLAVPGVAPGQAPAKVRIGLLSGGSPASNPFREAFREGLRELGWVEGQNLALEYRFADGHLDRLPALAAELVRLRVDVIVAGPSPSALAAKKATTTIPIVMAGVGFPDLLGLVASLARPGGNVTGVAFSVGPDVFAKGLELLREVAPRLRRVAVLANPLNPGHAVVTANVKEAARSLEMEMLLLDARKPEELDAAFATTAKERAGALLVVTDPLFVAQRTRIADLAARSRRPAVYAVSEFVDAGGLMSYGPNLVAQYRRAAVFADKILRGAKPADLPVEQPTTYELIVNLKTAQVIGVTIPPSLVQRADRVIR